MVDFETILGLVVVGSIGFILWAFTNWHLWKGILGIKADIDVKRAGTEDFVKEELRILKVGLKDELGGENLKGSLQAQIEGLQADFKSELAGLESRLATVQIDARPIMDQVTAELIPAVEAKIEHVKAVIQGAKGYAIKGVKALGESVAGITGEKALEEAGISSEWEMRLAQLGMDDEWAKRNKTAAFGLSLIKEALSRGENVRVVDYVPSGAKRVGPPKGFG